MKVDRAIDGRFVAWPVVCRSIYPKVALSVRWGRWVFDFDDPHPIGNLYATRCLSFWSYKLRGRHRGTAQAGQWFPDYV